MIVGTQALKDPDWFAPDGRESTRTGWSWASTPATARSRPRAGSRSRPSTPSTWPREFDDLPLAAVIYTDIARDGMLEGPEPGATADLAAPPRRPR